MCEAQSLEVLLISLTSLWKHGSDIVLSMLIQSRLRLGYVYEGVVSGITVIKTIGMRQRLLTVRSSRLIQKIKYAPQSQRIDSASQN